MRPNLLYIFADQLNGFSLGCNGNPGARTPHLDALAARGTVMRYGYSCAPVCTPARITMWTGRFAGPLGCLDNDARIPQEIPTMADAFRGAGYFTSYVGKWHIGGTGNRPVPEELRGGFEAFAGFQCYNEFRKDVRFFDERNQPIEFPGRHRTDATFDLAIARLRAAAGAGRPFLLCVSEQAPHYPCQPSEEFLARFRGRELRTRPNAGIGVDPYTPTYSPPSPPKEEDPAYLAYGGDMAEYLRHYHAAVAQVDAGAGRLVAELETLGIAGNTVVVFSSDHGDLQGSHGRTNKCAPYEESVRVPFLAAGPGIAKGAVQDDPISTVDFFPSFADICGVRIPDGVSGRSMASALAGRGASGRAQVFAEDHSGWALVIEGRWKLVADIQARRALHLFDLESDPFEMNDVLGSSGTAEIRGRLVQALQEWRSRNPLP